MTTTGRSNWQATLKTVVLLATLGGLRRCRLPDRRTVDRSGLLFIAVAINIGSWFFSDKIALAATRAKPVSEEEDPRLYQMVRDLPPRRPADAEALRHPAGAAEYHSPPAATRTTRRWPWRASASSSRRTSCAACCPTSASVTCDRDILLTSVVASIASAITSIGYMVLWIGGDNNSRSGSIGPLLLWLLAPHLRRDHRQRDLRHAGTGRRDGCRDLRQPGVLTSALLLGLMERRQGRCAIVIRRPSRCTSSSRSRAVGSRHSSRRIRR